MQAIIAPEFEQYREHIERIATLLDIPLIRVESSSFSSHAKFEKPDTVWISMREAQVYGHHIIHVIAHEMRHVYQYRNNLLARTSKLIFGFGYFICSEWCGKSLSFEVKTQADYESLPWEQDANQFADSYMANYVTQKQADAA